MPENAILPITEPQAQAVFDALVDFLEARENPLERAATEVVRVAVDRAALPEFWDFLKAKGLVQ